MKPLKTLVIHGNANQGIRLSPDSLDRANFAIKLLATGSFSKIIATGGLFEKNQGTTPVAEALNLYLKEKISVPIETEPKSLTTIHNVELLREILNNDSVVVVTSDYHVARTKLIWRLIGKKKVEVMGAPSTFKVTFRKKTVELFGIMVALLYWANIKFPEMFFRKTARKI